MPGTFEGKIGNLRKVGIRAGWLKKCSRNYPSGQCDFQQDGHASLENCWPIVTKHSLGARI